MKRSGPRRIGEGDARQAHAEDESAQRKVLVVRCGRETRHGEDDLEGGDQRHPDP